MRADRFVPLITPPSALDRPALWFVFQGNELLVAGVAARASVPVARDPAEIGIAVVRRQYLGALDGYHCFSAEAAIDAPAPTGLNWSALRPLFGLLEDPVFAIAGRAVQVVDWDRSHQFCGRCGAATEVSLTERCRVCPRCGQLHYPRIAPVVMALVRKEDQLLLARSPRFAPGMHSALAGFVEAGESLEESLAREVREEVGLEIANPRYFSSQSWPFPHSLMIAFLCDYAGGEIRVDGVEIESAAWFSLDALPTLPHQISIARRLIDASVESILSERSRSPQR
jgi:NAD+ diphosphatase